MITYIRPWYRTGTDGSLALYHWFRKQPNAIYWQDQFLEFSDEATLLMFKQSFDL